MERPTKRAKLQIEVVLRAEEEDKEADADSRGRINIEDVNVQMLDEDSESDILANNNYIDEEEEARQLDDTQVSLTENVEAEPENEEDADEDEEEYLPCDWCKETLRSAEDKELLMIFDEDVCRRCVMESDLEQNQDGEWDYPEGQFHDSENASDDWFGSDITVISLSDTEDEAEPEPEA